MRPGAKLWTIVLVLSLVAASGGVGATGADRGAAAMLTDRPIESADMPPTTGPHWADGGLVCPVCGDAFADQTDTTVARSSALVEIERQGAGHWHVENELTDESPVPTAGSLRPTLETLLGAHPRLDDVQNLSIEVEERTVHVRFTDPDAGTRVLGDTVVVDYLSSSNTDVAPPRFALSRLVVAGPFGSRPTTGTTEARVEGNRVVFNPETIRDGTVPDTWLAFAEDTGFGEPLQTDLSVLLVDLAGDRDRDPGLMVLLARTADLGQRLFLFHLVLLAALGTLLAGSSLVTPGERGRRVLGFAVGVAGIGVLTVLAASLVQGGPFGPMAITAAPIGLVWLLAGLGLATDDDTGATVGTVLLVAPLLAVLFAPIRGLEALVAALVFAIAGTALLVGAGVAADRRARAVATAVLVPGWFVLLAVVVDRWWDGLSYGLGIIFLTMVGIAALAPAVLLGRVRGSWRRRPR